MLKPRLELNLASGERQTPGLNPLFQRCGWRSKPTTALHEWVYAIQSRDLNPGSGAGQTALTSLADAAALTANVASRKRQGST